MGPVDAARFAARHGFQGLELNCEPLDFCPSLVSEATLREFIAIRDGEGIGFTLHDDATVNPGMDGQRQTLESGAGHPSRGGP